MGGGGGGVTITRSHFFSVRRKEGGVALRMTLVLTPFYMFYLHCFFEKHVHYTSKQGLVKRLCTYQGARTP